MGGYLPGKEVPEEKRGALSDYLRNRTSLHPEYIDCIQNEGRLPGTVETNYDGWESQPWFDAWVEQLPPKKRQNPFQGTTERRRVPLDPVSLKQSVHPHPMISSDAETLAGAMAMFNGDIAPEEIDLVLVSSLVPDYHVPLNASLIQHKLGLQNAGAYNVDTCCSSFVTMLELAMTYVRGGIKKKILVVGSAIDSLINDKCSYFSVYIGDGAVAAVVGEVEDEHGYISSHSISRGHRHSAIIFQNRQPTLIKTTSQGPSYEQEFVTFFDQQFCKEIAKNAQEDMVSVVNRTLEKGGFTVGDIDMLVTHQPVPWTPNAWREAIGVPADKFYESFAKYANIAVASAPTNMLEAVEQGLVKAGDRMMMASSGVGENLIAVFHRVPEQFIANNRLPAAQG
jgi:3-oxoacyl-[acyl-carrier-protein] synthase-3